MRRGRRTAGRWRNEVRSFRYATPARRVGHRVGRLGGRLFPCWRRALDYDADHHKLRLLPAAVERLVMRDVMPLTRVIDLLGRNTHLDEFLPPLAASLQTVANFDLLGVVVPYEVWGTAQLKFVCPGAPDGASTAAAEIQSMTVAPLDQARLAALVETGSPAMVFARLDEPGEYADVIAALRGFGQQSARLLPPRTALGSGGLIAFASSREGTYCQCDTSFLRHIGALVAMAIDNERHQQEAVARERQLQAERDHWRTLLEMTNAVVTQRDVAALRAAIVPNVRRIVPHDHTNLYLIDEQRRLGPFVIDPAALAWPDDLAAHIRPDTEPYTSWLAPFDRAAGVGVTHAAPPGGDGAPA